MSNYGISIMFGTVISETMQKLTNKEEEVMKILWKLKKAFVKEILEEIDGEKPHYNTLSTIVCRWKGSSPHAGDDHPLTPIGLGSSD